MQRRHARRTGDRHYRIGCYSPLVLVFAAMAIGFTIIHAWAMPAFSDYINALPWCERISALEKATIALLLFPAVAAGGWGISRARKLIRLEQFPLPGDRVIRKTPIRRGRAVRRKGYALLVLSVALLVLPFGGLYFADSIFVSLKERHRCMEQPSMPLIRAH